jgi:hypothetical protein
MTEEGEDAISVVTELEMTRSLELIYEIETIRMVCSFVRLHKTAEQKRDI